MAHSLPISFLRVVPGEDQVHLELTFNPFELNFFSELDWNKNGRLDPAEWEDQEKDLTRLLTGSLVLQAAGKPVKATVAGLRLDPDSHHATLRAHYPIEARRQALSIRSALGALTSGSHVTQVTFGYSNRVQAARLDLFSASVTFAPWGQDTQDAAPASATAETNPAPAQENGVGP